MAFLDYPGLTRFKNKFKAYLDGIFVKSVNNKNIDENGNVDIDKVAFADNLVADDAQSSSGMFVTRTTGGDASLSDGDAWLNVVRGNMKHEGYSARNVVMTVTPVQYVDRVGTITASINRATFVQGMDDTGRLILTYTSEWNIDPALYGITVTGTPAYGDKIIVDYTKEIIDMDVNAEERPTPAGLTATLDEATFEAYVETAGTYTVSYTDEWSTSPALYGLTITGTPESGDYITMTWDGEEDATVVVNSPRTPDPAITAEINKSTFRSYVSQSGVYTLTYTNEWSENPALYGVTVTNTPIDGDEIVITYVKEVIDDEVDAVDTVRRENPITATIDDEAFDNAVQENGTTTFEYTSSWDKNPASYGITVTNTPVEGDTISVVCTKEVRGTITVFKPAEFYSTNWNLYNNDLGYARTLHYSDQYGFYVGGTFDTNSVKFSTSTDPSATKTDVALTDVGDGMYYFEVEEDGFVWLYNANDTDTYIMMTWSDWQSGPPATFEAHTASTIDLSGIVGAGTDFPYGLMAVGNVQDEINISLQTAFSRIGRTTFTAEHLAEVRATGLPYEYDEDYIYFVKETVDTYEIDIDGLYLANDHGLEVFTGTFVPGYAQMLYGYNLKDKLRTDVLTISSQALSSAQQSQARSNIGAVASVNGQTPNSSGAITLPTDSTPTQSSTNYVTSGGVYTELAALNQRIGNAESPASVFQDIDFTIPTTGWQGSSAPYTAAVTNAVLTQTSGIWVFYDSSRDTYAKAPITAQVATSNGSTSVLFSTSVKPTGAISGYIRVVDSVNGIVPVERGGTGCSTVTDARNTLGIGNTSMGTSATTVTGAISEVNNKLTSITPVIPVTGVTVLSGGYILAGKIVILNVKITLSSEMPINSDLIYAQSSLINDSPLHANQGTVEHKCRTYNGRIVTSETFPAGTFQISGVYISAT